MSAILQRPAATVRVLAQLRAPGTSALRRAVTALLVAGERNIRLDLAALTDIDAAGLRELVSLSTMTMSAGGILRITCALAPVRHLLDDGGVLRFPGPSASAVGDKRRAPLKMHRCPFGAAGV